MQLKASTVVSAVIYEEIQAISVRTLQKSHLTLVFLVTCHIETASMAGENNFLHISMKVHLEYAKCFEYLDVSRWLGSFR